LIFGGFFSRFSFGAAGSLCFLPNAISSTLVAVGIGVICSAPATLVKVAIA